MSTHPLEEILHPQSIAVVGASDNPNAAGYCFTDVLIQHEFKGKIYPVNPRYSEIFGLKCYPNLKDIPSSIDYVISCVPAREVLGMLQDCSQKEVKAVHLYTARFSETGHRDAVELEREVLKQAKKSGIRLIGPNCRGVYYPKQGISFYYDFPKESGLLGLISQTGGGAGVFIESASLRGAYFSKAISYGNAIDLNESDYLEYLAQDSETRVIMMYIEGVKDGKRFFNTLRQAASIKPVIVLKGGRGKSGARIAASHTASLAGSLSIWKALIRQAGAVSADSIEEMIDLAVSFYFLPQITGLRVGIAGGSGGPSVLGADECEEAGLDVVPLPQEMREEFKNMGASGWDWIRNPADMSMLGGFDFTGSDMLGMMSRYPDFDLLIGYIQDIPSSKKELRIPTLKAGVEGYIGVKKESAKPLLMIVPDKSVGIKDYDDLSWKAICEARTNLIAADIPIYPTIGRAAKAAKKLIDYYQRRQ